MNELDFIDKCVERVKKYAEMVVAYRDENEKLKKLLYEIRTETQRCDLTENNYDSIVYNYKPIRNTTKQDVYKSYMKIKKFLKGQYVLLSNESAIDDLIGKGLQYDDNE